MTRTSYSLNGDHLNYMFLMMFWIVFILAGMIYVAIDPSPFNVIMMMIGLFGIPLLIILIELRKKQVTSHKYSQPTL